MNNSEYDKGRNKGFNNTGVPTNVHQVAGHMAGEEQRNRMNQRHSGVAGGADADETPEWLKKCMPYTTHIGWVAGVILALWFFGLSFMIIPFAIVGLVLGSTAPIWIYKLFIMVIAIVVIFGGAGLFVLFLNLLDA